MHSIGRPILAILVILASMSAKARPTVIPEAVLITHQAHELQAKTAQFISYKGNLKELPHFILSSKLFPLVSDELSAPNAQFIYSQMGGFDEGEAPLATKVHVFGGGCKACLHNSIGQMVVALEKQGIKNAEFVFYSEHIYLDKEHYLLSQVDLLPAGHPSRLNQICEELLTPEPTPLEYLFHTYRRLASEDSGLLQETQKFIEFERNSGFKYRLTLQN